MNDPKGKSLETALGQALKEAVDDETFRKVKRMSYSGNAAGEVSAPLVGDRIRSILGVKGTQVNDKRRC